MAVSTQNIDIHKTVKAWEFFTRKDWAKNFTRLRIGNTAAANNRVEGKIIGAEGGTERIEFTYDFVLNFVRWGVGRGVDIGDVRFLTIARRLEGKRAGNRRKPKRWFEKPYRFNVARLAELLGEKYRDKSIQTIVHTIENKQ